jgi:hypothetical protein
MSLVVHEKIDMHLMNVGITYLYGNLDNDIYMKISEEFNIPEAYNSGPRGNYFVKLQKSLYGLKQYGRMWHNHLSEYLLKSGHKNVPIYPCVFIKKSGYIFVMLAIYVDDINLIGTREKLQKTRDSLHREFEIKDFGSAKFCLCLQIEHLEDDNFIHQSIYTSEKNLYGQSTSIEYSNGREVIIYK